MIPWLHHASWLIEMTMLTSAIIVWLEFALCAAVIAIAGNKLSRYSDIIVDKTGSGGAWNGLALMVPVTSLPELVTGVSPLALADTPNIALGLVLGACIINMTMIVFLDLFLFLYGG